MEMRQTILRDADVTPDLDPALLPSETDVAAYEARGWHHSPRILPDALIDATREAIERHQNSHRDRPLPRPAQFSDWQPGDGDGVRNNEFCSIQNDAVRALLTLPILGATMARLMRTEAVRLWDDQAIWKPSVDAGTSPTAVGWHTDHAYWSTCTSDRMLTAWIPFEDATEENGALQVIEGSHFWSGLDHLRGFNDPNLDNILEQIGQPADAAPIVSMNIRKGQVSFHHMRLLHASTPNRSTAPRLALAAHVQDADNRYRPYTSTTGVAVVLPHDQLCRRTVEGAPDYSDPDIFTQLWPPRNLPSA